jgi:starch-binding outer membrane protein, SusD/RagB family
MIDSDMKKITNLLYMLAVLLLASCSDFLDKSPKNTVDPETTVTDDVAKAASFSYPSQSLKVKV